MKKHMARLDSFFATRALASINLIHGTASMTACFMPVAPT